MKSLSAGSGQTLVLIISLAFNLGFCLALGVQRVGRDSKPPCDDRRGERGDMEERLAREFGLSDAQRAAVRESKQRMFPDGEDGPRGMRASNCLRPIRRTRSASRSTWPRPRPGGSSGCWPWRST
jgi:hypothetical protein